MIGRLLRDGTFSPEEIARMTAAYHAALQLLEMDNDPADPVTELIAKKIIDVTKHGENDPPRICARALRELGIPFPD